METLIGLILPYVSIALFIIGALYRTITWSKAPNVLNWRLYPVPHGVAGEAKYMLEEVLAFKSLIKHNRVVWLGSYVFHLSMVILILWFVLFLMNLALPWLVRLGAILMLGSCVYLFLVRLLVGPMRHVSTLVEFFNLSIFILFALTGLIFLGQGLDGPARAYYIGLLTLHPVAPPNSLAFLINLLLLEFIVAYLPFSKMFHMASKYFTYHKLKWWRPHEAPLEGTS
jgi:nitrate reductase gamma subunit